MDLIADKETTKQFVLMDELDYGVDSRDFIRQALAGYAGGSAIASELLQNADDARADSISFHFRRDALVVRNSSSFSEKDFANILNIASGGKREETETIGTWGTGFLSVFHITDRPILESAGYRIEFDPSKRRLPRYGSGVMNGTVFTFPWRREVTDLSKHIEARVWNDDEIDALKQDLVVAIYRLNLFLRHVRSISVFQDDPDERILASVQRMPRSAEATPFYTRETWEVQYQRAGVQSRSDTWVYYQGVVPSHPAIQDTAIKDRAVALAFPLESRGWLIENVPGSLYNFLPTPIQTGFGFQLNGAFFPNNNRNSIILDEHTHPQKSRWNNAVLRTMGDLLVTALLDIRDLVSQPRRFYELPPVEEPRYDFLKPIHDAFASAAPDLPIVFSSLSRWCSPQEVYVGAQGSRLPGLVSDYLDVLPIGVPQAFRNYLSRISSTLIWRDVLDFLEPHLECGQALSQAHPMIASRDRLHGVYTEFPRSLLPEDKSRLRALPLCLTEDGVLVPFGEVWRADQDVRDLLRLVDIPFVDLETQQEFSQLLEQLVSRLRGSELVSFLQDDLRLESPLELSSLDFLVEDFDHLARLIEFIDEDRANADQAALEKLPVVRTRNDLLVAANDLVFFPGASDTVEQSMLEDMGIRFVHTEWTGNASVRRVIARAGVTELRPRDVVDALSVNLAAWLDLPIDTLIEKLIGIYDFFRRHERQLLDNDRESLRRLPLCVTQKGRPVAAATTLVHLPPRDGMRQYDILAILDSLQLDHLLDSRLVRHGEGFLSKTLGVQALDSGQLIRDIIVRHYNDDRLDDSARQHLLRYISEQMQGMPRHQREDIWSDLRRARLVRCADGVYRPAHQVYFASPALDAVFPDGYHRLHPDYSVPVARSEDQEQQPFRHSTCYWLFRELGVNEQPAPVDMFNTVKLTVEQTTPDDKGAIDRIRSIYQYLNVALGENKELASDASLRRLAQLPWLPSRHDSSRWYLPRDLYQASRVSFIGDQAPLLAFAESEITLRELLQMPAFPPVSLVVKNLLSMAERGTPVEKFNIYTDIGRRWAELSSAETEALSRASVVWDPSTEKYWLPSRVFLGDFRRQFGHRRAYLAPPGGDAQIFLERVGAKSQPYSWTDYLDLLIEIAHDFQRSQELSEADRRLLIGCFEHLGRREDSEQYESLRRQLGTMSFVPGQDSRLHLPSRVVFADQPGILDQFDPSAIATVDETGMTEAAYNFLRRSVGVASLSKLVQRLPVEILDRDEEFGLERSLRQLSDPFKRIMLTLQDRNGNPDTETESIDRLRSVRVFTCTRLLVEYSLEAPDGWRVSGHRTEEEALYDLDDNYFFLKRSDGMSFSTLPVAQELERIFFPEYKESVLIERLLDLPGAQIGLLLDKHGYRRLFVDDAPPDQSVDKPLGEWGDVTLDPLEPDEGGEDQTIDSTVDDDLDLDTWPDSRDDDGTGSEGFDKEIDTWDMSPSQARQHIDGRTSAGNGQIHLEPTTGDVDDDRDTVPPFTGIRYPTVPVLPNDYEELERKYGLRRPADLPPSVGIAFEDGVFDDAAWTAGEATEGVIDDKDPYVTLVRFTLTFVNRYQGFLPLHHNARRMLHDRPTVLHCETDFEGQAFDLYVDYDQNIIYNQVDLTAFFEAHAIPAGGIIYLERVHGIACRLFWKPSDASISNVRCLELLADGTLNDYEIPAIDIPCEVAEFVLRAEKRLEDPDALFRQAADRRGIFHTICDVFGERDRELSYEEIFSGVMAWRQVAKASIDHQLDVRPCFVRLNGNRWRFEPERGIEPPRGRGASDQFQPPRPQGREATGNDARGSNQRTPQAEHTPYAMLVSDIKHQFGEWSRSLDSSTLAFPRSLQQLAISLAGFAQTLGARLNVLMQEHHEADETLLAYWRALVGNPDDKEASRVFEGYLLQRLRMPNGHASLQEIEWLLAQTSQHNRDHIVYPRILQIANSIQHEDADLARSIYEFLERLGAGNFATQIGYLREISDVRDWLADMESESSSAERWIRLSELWEIYPRSTDVRSAIQAEFKRTAASIDLQLSNVSRIGDVSRLASEFLEWRDCVTPLANAWETDAKCVARLTNLAIRMFRSLIDQARTDSSVCWSALHVASALSVEDLRLLPADRYLEAIGVVAGQVYEQEKDVMAATVLYEYAVYLFRSHYQRIDESVVAVIYERAARLYEEINWFCRAYRRLGSAQRHSKDHGTKMELGREVYELKTKCDPARERNMSDTWFEYAAQLISARPQMASLISFDIYQTFLRSLDGNTE